MPTTRRAAQQAKLEDFTNDAHELQTGHRGKDRETKTKMKTTEQDPDGGHANTVPQTRGVKRKASSDGASTAMRPRRDRSRKQTLSSRVPTSDQSAAPGSKRQKQLGTSSVDDLESPIIINRSPVLQLWGGAVAHFLHPRLSWSTCLSMGSAISSLCAVSKGRAIGVIEPKSQADDQKHPASEAADDKDGVKQLMVMGFSINLKDDVAVVDGKKRNLSDAALSTKFGPEQYERVKKAMDASLKTWSQDKDGLDKKAFHMYEKFRPTVPQGQQGWGSKAELNLHLVQNTVKRSKG